MKTTDIVLAAKIARHLATFPEPVVDVLANCAAASAAEHLHQGWDPIGAPYDIGAMPGDAQDASDKLGRKLSREEARALEECIREHLNSAASEGIEEASDNAVEEGGSFE